MDGRPEEAPAQAFRRAMAWLKSFTDYEQSQPKGPLRSAFDLARVDALWRDLGYPARDLPVLHVTGTKGKTTATILGDAVLAAHGVRSSRFVSPHVERLHERFCVGGQDIDDAGFARAAKQLAPVVDAARASSPDRTPTFFECLTLIAFLDSEARGARAMVLEVGLGGRLDATNVVPASTAVITSIALDHTRMLGSTHAAIAREKAGIIKRGSVVYTGLAPGDPGFTEIASRAGELGCSLVHPGAGIGISRCGLSRGEDGEPVVEFDAVNRQMRFEGLRIQAGSAHQATNALLAVAGACEILSTLGIPVDEDAVRKGLADARVPGRSEWRKGPPPLLLDGAHTRESVAAAVDTARFLAGGAPVLALVGLTADREPERVFASMVSCRQVMATNIPSPRSMSPHDLARALSGMGVSASAEPDPTVALAAAESHAARTGGLLLVTGSLYLVGEVRRLLAARLTGDRGPATIPG